MSLTRRAFIKFLSIASLLKYSPSLFAAPSMAGFEKTLALFLDTLMPADETPAASELHIDLALLKKAEANDRYRRLLLNGCLWLENTALDDYQLNFTDLSEQQRIGIVESMEQSETGTIANVFFKRVQTDLFEHYYSHPASWQGLGIEQPPQPQGYPDYDRPPAAMS